MTERLKQVIQSIAEASGGAAEPTSQVGLAFCVLPPVYMPIQSRGVYPYVAIAGTWLRCSLFKFCGRIVVEAAAVFVSSVFLLGKFEAEQLTATATAEGRILSVLRVRCFWYAA